MRFRFRRLISSLQHAIAQQVGTPAQMKRNRNVIVRSHMTQMDMREHLNQKCPVNSKRSRATVRKSKVVISAVKERKASPYELFDPTMPVIPWTMLRKHIFGLRNLQLIHTKRLEGPRNTSKHPQTTYSMLLTSQRGWNVDL